MVCGAIIGVIAFVVSLVHGDSVVRALGAALGLDLLTMGVCGVSERFWGGDKVTKMSAAGTGFEFPDAAEPIRKVNERVDSQMTELEQRLYALEEPEEGKNEENDA